MSFKVLILAAGHAVNGVLHRHGYHVCQFPKHRADSLIDVIRDNGFETYVEVGVWKADSSKKVLAGTELKKAWLVDPYSTEDPGGLTQQDLDRLYEQVRGYFARRHPQVEMVREPSEKARERFDDESLDVVFVDGVHTYEGLKSEIAHWWPKIRRGGVLFGDDFETEYEGLIRAVAERFPLDKLHFAPDSVWWVRKDQA